MPSGNRRAQAESGVTHGPRLIPRAFCCQETVGYGKCFDVMKRRLPDSVVLAALNEQVARNCSRCFSPLTGRLHPQAKYCVRCAHSIEVEMHREHQQMRPLQWKAHDAVARAVKCGHLQDLREAVVRCVDCGEPATCYDHRDYRKPLEVEPVCRGCNSRRGPGHPYREVAA